MVVVRYISNLVKEFILQILLFFENCEYSPVLPEEPKNDSELEEEIDLGGVQHNEKSRYGQLRFRLAYLESSCLLRVTIVDAWDLPPMDDNGLADPYVEVSLRTKSSSVAQDKFKTSVKTTCLNPVFNETAEMPLTLDNVGTGELVIKVMDCDFECQDELIGSIRIPLAYMGMSSEPKEHTCLILHDTKGEDGSIEVTDGIKKLDREISKTAVATLQLEISDQASKIYDMKLLLKSNMEELAKAKEDGREQKSEEMDQELENYNLTAKIEHIKNKIGRKEMTQEEAPEDVLCMEPDDNSFKDSKQSSIDEFFIDDDPIQTSKSMQGSSHLMRIAPGSNINDHSECQEHLRMQRQKMEQKDFEINQLRGLLDALEPSLGRSVNGEMELGLCFSPISSRVSVKILSANKLNAKGYKEQGFNPFSKIKVNFGSYHNRPSEKFKTKIIHSTTSPIWNETFDINDIDEEYLSDMSVEIDIICLLGNRKRNTPLGKIRIGPNQLHDNQHWEKMTTQHGTFVTMVHAIGDV